MNKILSPLLTMSREVLTTFLKIFARKHRLGLSNLDRIPIEVSEFQFKLDDRIS